MMQAPHITRRRALLLTSLLVLGMALGILLLSETRPRRPMAFAQGTQSAPAPAPAGWEELGLRDWGLAPEISLPAADGSGTVKLSELVESGPVLVDFWATWCGPCRKAMPQYVTLYETYRDRGFRVLAVSQDSPQVVDKVLEFSAKLELPFPVVMDVEKKAGSQYRVRSLPTSYLIDQRGHVVGVEIGYLPGREKHLAEQIEALLDAPGLPGVEG